MILGSNFDGLMPLIYAGFAFIAVVAVLTLLLLIAMARAMLHRPKQRPRGFEVMHKEQKNV